MHITGAGTLCTRTRDACSSDRFAALQILAVGAPLHKAPKRLQPAAAIERNPRSIQISSGVDLETDDGRAVIVKIGAQGYFAPRPQGAGRALQVQHI